LIEQTPEAKWRFYSGLTESRNTKLATVLFAGRQPADSGHLLAAVVKRRILETLRPGLLFSDNDSTWRTMLPMTTDMMSRTVAGPELANDKPVGLDTASVKLRALLLPAVSTRPMSQNKRTAKKKENRPRKKKKDRMSPEEKSYIFQGEPDVYKWR
jgi:hypothetical protein